MMTGEDSDVGICKMKKKLKMKKERKWRKVRGGYESGVMFLDEG